MAVDNHGSDIRHSLYGRMYGLDVRGLGVYGSPAIGYGGDLRYGTETITSTLPSTLAPAATSILQATGSAVYELVTPQASMVGVRKRIFNNSTGAVAMLVKLTSGNFIANTGSSAVFNTISLTTRGTGIDIEYISSNLIAVMGQTTAAGYFAFTTTT